MSMRVFVFTIQRHLRQIFQIYFSFLLIHHTLKTRLRVPQTGLAAAYVICAIRDNRR